MKTHSTQPRTLIASPTAPRYYGPALPVTLQVDASEDAIGGVLLQNDQPVYFTSKVSLHLLDSDSVDRAQLIPGSSQYDWG